MRRRQVLSSVAISGLLSPLGLLYPASAFAQTRNQEGLDLPQALGQWTITVTFLDGPHQGSQEKAQVAVLPNTLFTSVSTSDPSQFALAGCGIWQSTGAKTFTFDLREFALDSAAHILYLVRVHQHARVSDDGMSFTSMGWGKMYSKDGQFLGSVQTSGQATRIQ
ncbi:MAG TPA: hypothetical protein VFV38_52860 [Ktedonobacteraceae bacterium]|nr:hypothetical protein [Ktedonobacteraceae bacterium]